MSNYKTKQEFINQFWMGQEVTTFKRLTHNRARLESERYIVEIYEDTIICSIDKQNGWKLTLNSGGWFSNTTKKAMNDFMTEYGYYLAIKQKNYAWYFMKRSYKPGEYWDFDNLEEYENLRVIEKN